MCPRIVLCWGPVPGVRRWEQPCRRSRAAQGTPGVTVACPSLAQVALAGGQAAPDRLCAAEGWCVATPCPLTR